MTPSALKALRAAALPTKDGKIWVSTNDAVAALIWRSLIAATYAGIEESDSDTLHSNSCCQVAITVRGHLIPPPEGSQVENEDSIPKNISYNRFVCRSVLAASSVLLSENGAVGTSIFFQQDLFQIGPRIYS